MFNGQLSLLISNINRGYKTQRFYFEMNSSKFLTEILCFFKKKNLIEHMSLSYNKKRIRVTLNKYSFSNHINKKKKLRIKQEVSILPDFYNPTLNLKLVASKQKRVFLSLRELRYLDNFTKIYVLTTRYGYLTHKEALILKTGGELIFTYTI